MFILLLFLSNPAPKSSRKPTSGHCISRTELHFWCKYRYNSEILQTKSNIFLKKSQKLAILSDFFYKNQRFWCEILFIYRGLHTFQLSLFLLRSVIRSSYTLFILFIIGCLIYFACKVTTIFGKNKYFCDFLSEISRLWRSGERNDITDILHTCDEKDEPFETQSETGMGA